MLKNINEIMQEFVDFSIPTFDMATPFSSLIKLEKQELPELKEALNEFEFSESMPNHSLVDEYTDCIMCLFDSAVRAGFSIESINASMLRKTMVNKSRKWKLNPDKTYSHIK